MKTLAYTVNHPAESLATGTEIRTKSGGTLTVVDLRDDEKSGPGWVRFGLADEVGNCVASMSMLKGEHVLTSYHGAW